MDINQLQRVSDYQWRIEPTGKMRVPAVIYASEDLIRDCLLYTSDAADESSSV